MVYKIKINIDAVFIHARTLQKLNVKECIETNCGDLEEMERIAEEYDIEVSVDSNSPDYEKKLVEAIGEMLRLKAVVRVNKISDTLREIYLKDMNGVIELGGYMLNAKEFCGMKIQRVAVDIKERV